jgi:hypothetical protein
VKLVPIDKLIPASYNPRTVDPERLDLVRLSIRKLGWLLPVYATASGELLSGHQRTYVARDLGYTHVPCVTVPDMDENTRKAVNILFNRSTNDMAADSIPGQMRNELRSMDVLSLAEGIGDRTDFYPCLNGANEPISKYLRTNSGGWLQYSRNVAVSLYGYDIIMPIIVDPEDVVVNGIGRLQMLAEKRIAEGYFVHLDRSEAEFARVMLNLLSMDFSIHEKYADLLRFNSFRRARLLRRELGRGFVFALVDPERTEDVFNCENPANMEKWKAKYGLSVVDFGAGHLHETDILRDSGVRVSPFEPYRIAPRSDTIDKEASVSLAREFLNDVASGVSYSSVFVSSVLNSVPFVEDRKRIVKICSALCGGNTTCYGWALGDNHPSVTGMKTRILSLRAMKTNTFLLNYEPNITLGEFQSKPKIQKFHSSKEFYDLFKSAFEFVNVKNYANDVGAICRGCSGFAGLREALEFEFDLPYPDGSHMGLASDAVRAFEKRLGVKL